jgi:hypothetical protein
VTRALANKKEGDQGHSPSYWLKSQAFSRINTPTFSKLAILHIYPSMKMEQTECSETSAFKIQTPGNYPEASIQHSEHGGSLKSRKCLAFTANQTAIRVSRTGLSSIANIPTLGTIHTEHDGRHWQQKVQLTALRILKTLTTA